MCQGLTSSAGRTVWHPPDRPHTPEYPEPTTGGKDGPNPIATELHSQSQAFVHQAFKV